MFQVLDIINKFIPDVDEAKRLSAQVEIAHQKAINAAVDADKQVRLAELRKGGIASIWRPLAALMIFFCLFLYWGIYPTLQIFIGLFNLNIYLPELTPLPENFYFLGSLFITIYAAGRSLEKRGL